MTQDYNSSIQYEIYFFLCHIFKKYFSIRKKGWLSMILRVNLFRDGERSSHSLK